MGRQIQSLKNNLRLCTQANTDIEGKIGNVEQELEQLTKTIEGSNGECARLESESDALRSEVSVASVEKQRNFSELLKIQRTAKRYDEFAMGGHPPPAPVPQNIRAQYTEQLALKQKSTDVLRLLQEGFPQLEQLWDQFDHW